MADFNKMLLSAAESGDLDGVNEALNQGADVNTIEADFKQTPLHKASSGGHVEIVKILFEHGADPLMQDGVDMTATIYISPDCGSYLGSGAFSDCRTIKATVDYSR